MKKLLALLIGAVGILATPAYADFTGKNAAGTTVTFKNPVDCTSVVCIPIYAQYDSTGVNAVAVVTSGADAVSNTATGALGYSRNLIFNGTTWDRWQGAVTNAGTFAVQLTGTTNTVQGTGASGAALAGNPFRVGLSDGTNSQNWLASIALADGVNGNNTGSVASWLWNGTTYDRARGDLTNGAYVNVRTSVLPTGAATAANQTTANTSLASIATNTAAATPAGTSRIGYTSDDPCAQKAKTNLAISQNGTSSVQLVGLSGSTVIYVCSLSLVTAGATTVALTTGTGTACVTGNAAVIGTTTAGIANSMSFAANGGLTLGNGGGTIAQGAASGELCMVLGTSVFVSGNLTYVQQ